MSPPLSPALLLLAVVVLFSHTVQAMTGFGSTVIALTLGSLFFPIEELRLVLVALNLPLSLFVILRQGGSIDRGLLFGSILRWMGLGVVVGLVLGGFIGGVLMRRVFGGLVMVFAFRELWAISRGHAPKVAAPLVTHAWLVAAGVVHGVYASGGPLLVTALSGVRLDRRTMRATLMALWFTLSVVLLTVALVRGQWTRAITVDTVLLLPTLPVGAALGEWLHHRVPDTAFRALIQVVLLVAGGALLV